MNCKQGDLAIVVKSFAGNEGRIVRCVEFSGVWILFGPDKIYRKEDTWRTDPPLRTWTGDMTEFSADKNLRPIRDNPGKDETLQWAPVPVDAVKSNNLEKEVV